MGKYTRKTKPPTDIIAVIDVSQSSLGVRTRATTLALQKLQSLKPTSLTPPQDLSYLQLRSRKLHKPPLPLNPSSKQNPNPRLNSIGSCGSGPNAPGSNLGGVESNLDGETEACCDLGTDTEEACVGENNNLDLDGKERSTRESTPCSFIRDSNDSITPGSSTRHATVPNSIQSIMPSAQEIEEFFARHAQEQQRLFSEKYNFDIVNEKPLQGRYEWVRVQP
ncbi:hypothetical protein M8C21_004729 [Ambrosia artemisiifolia]|uniref:Cyclin-dependent kinase inhibitor n=1 Tax=Ambrosia artemisiifolia TaxID=4212 RepID=A0AAD5G3A5_AMBAR|nr:hypothetical protein M8C21_004729 [Ambrosia artemisiifolia]